MTAEVAYSAVQQDSVVPRGWSPSYEKPVPVVRCVHRWPDEYPDGRPHPRAGERCGRWSLRGHTLCYKHSGNGNFANVDKYREAVVESARLRLVGDTDMAVDVLEDVMKNGTSEAARIKAATEVLDRAGVRGGTELDISVDGGADPGQALRDRLSTIRTRVVDVTPTPLPPAEHGTVSPGTPPPATEDVT